MNWEHDRKGVMNSPELVQSLEVATPPDFPGGMEGIWSPEHLYVASVNSCLMTTFLSVAENSKLRFSGFRSKAVGTLERKNDTFIISTIQICPEVTVARKRDLKKAYRILEKAESACLISNSIKSEIVMQPEVKVQEMAYES